MAAKFVLNSIPKFPHVLPSQSAVVGKHSNACAAKRPVRRCASLVAHPPAWRYERPAQQLQRLSPLPTMRMEMPAEKPQARSMYGHQSNRNRGSLLLAAFLLVATTQSSFAKLPAPTPEQKTSAEKQADLDKAQLLKEQEALGRAQDRVSDRYRQELVRQGKVPPTPTPVVAITATKDLPKVVGVKPGADGPHGGTTPSAEAHSAPAK